MNTTKEKAYSDATVGDIYETLRDLDFAVHDENEGCFDCGRVRVIVSDDDDGVRLLRFTKSCGAGVVAYDVSFDWNTPLEIIACAIRTAVDYQ